MSHSRCIQIDHLARTEGETALQVVLDRTPAIELKIFEPPRFFEGLLVGRRFDEVGDLVSRICGICPVSHMTTAILAVEQAMEIQVSQQTTLLRTLMSISQIVASHLVHLYMLAMPDYYGRAGMIQMLPDFEGKLQRLLKMKDAINSVTATIGGRALHPITHLPGGFTRIPPPRTFHLLLQGLKGIQEEAKEVVNDIAALAHPHFVSDSEYVALNTDAEYAINEGHILSNKGLDIDVEDYREFFEEQEVPYAMAKQTRIKGRASFMVGALARLHIKFDKLQEETRKVAKETGYENMPHNPFINNMAQALEVHDGILRCIRLIESHSFEDEDRTIDIKAGEGAAVTEAPRGVLYHWYRINRKGIVEAANIVTPTSHNFLNIEKDLKKLVEENLHQGRKTIQILCEKLVRAYDPCFSCSVH